MGQASEEQLNNPLHGVKQKQLLEHLIETIGWEEMYERTGIRAFQIRPTLTSSLRFIRKTEWARKKVQDLYLETLEPKFHESVYSMWDAFIKAKPEYKDKSFDDSFYFCDNETDAQECATLVQQGIKKATSTSVWWFEKFNEAFPEVGNIYIITDWYKIAKAIVKVNQIDRVAFKDITEEYAAIEGEGDKSLKYWRKSHWEYYGREMAEFNDTPTEDMEIICEQFELIWK